MRPSLVLRGIKQHRSKMEMRLGKQMRHMKQIHDAAVRDWASRSVLHLHPGTNIMLDGLLRDRQNKHGATACHCRGKH